MGMAYFRAPGFRDLSSYSQAALAPCGAAYHGTEACGERGWSPHGSQEVGIMTEEPGTRLSS